MLQTKSLSDFLTVPGTLLISELGGCVQPLFQFLETGDPKTLSLHSVIDRTKLGNSTEPTHTNNTWQPWDSGIRLGCIHFICLAGQTHFHSWSVSSSRAVPVVLMTILQKREGHMCWHRPPSALSVWCEWSQRWAKVCFECSSKINPSFSEDDTGTDLSYWLDLKPGREMPSIPLPSLSLTWGSIYSNMIRWCQALWAFEEGHLHQSEQQVCRSGF